MTGTPRRRVAAILALAVGFGVVLSSAPASANPSHSNQIVTTVPASTSTAAAATANDWWW